MLISTSVSPFFHLATLFIFPLTVFADDYSQFILDMFPHTTYSTNRFWKPKAMWVLQFRW